MTTPDLSYRDIEESIDLSAIAHDSDSAGDDRTEVMTLNIGPHHPATHGVLRLIVELDG